MMCLVWFGGKQILEGNQDGRALTGELFITFIVVFSQLLRHKFTALETTGKHLEICDAYRVLNTQAKHAGHCCFPSTLLVIAGFTLNKIYLSSEEYKRNNFNFNSVYTWQKKQHTL